LKFTSAAEVSRRSRLFGLRAFSGPANLPQPQSGCIRRCEPKDRSESSAG